MIVPTSCAAQSLADLEQTFPAAAALARYASLATRVDASLLRRLRLQMLPGLDAGAEADLWFSDLAQSRDSDGWVLDPAIAQLLRQQLAAECLPDGRRALDLVYALTRELHAGWPASLQLEEELVYLALRDGALAADRIDALLRPALAAMASQAQRGVEVSRWVVRAMPQLPAVVRESDAARALSVAASAILGADPELLEGLSECTLPADFQWLVPASALTERVRLQCELRGAALVFQAASAHASPQDGIELPLTRPLMAEMRVIDGDGVTTCLLLLKLGEPVALPASWQRIELRGLDGVTHHLERASRPATAEPVEYRIDVFISYVHVDNQPLKVGDRGWVTQLHAVLQTMLAQRMGRQASVWLDPKLRGEQAFEDELSGSIAKSRVFVCIASPHYLSSEWCRRELQLFTDAAQAQGALTVGNRSRVVKVLRQPIDDSRELPPALSQTRGYEFFELADGMRAQELNPAFGGESRQRFLQQVSVLASDIADLLRAMERDAAEVSETAPARGSVYLAECGRDVRVQRENLRSELQARGWRVLPQTALPLDEEGCRKAVSEQLAQSALSVHLVGSDYGVTLDGPSGVSVSVLQNELAVQQSRRSSLQRLIWTGHVHRSEHALQQRFIEALHQDSEMQFGADLLTGSFETFRGAVVDALQKAERHPVPQSAREPGRDTAVRRVYLLCDERDLEMIETLAAWCREAGLVVELPVFEGSAADVRQAHRDRLARCDAVILYWGAADLRWYLATKSEIRKVTAAREMPLLAHWTWVGAPDSAEKQDRIDVGERDLIDARAGANVQAQLAFLRALDGDRGVA